MCSPEVVQPPPSSLPARERLRELLLTFAAGVSGLDSVRLYRAIVAEADRMPGLGRLFWEAGPRQVRAAIAQLWAKEHDAATAPIVAEQLVQLALGDAFQELVLGTGSPAPEIFGRQIDAALALLGLTTCRPRQRKRTGRGPSASGPHDHYRMTAGGARSRSSPDLTDDRFRDRWHVALVAD